MRTDCKTVYRYSELSEDAQEVAREETRENLAEWMFEDSDQLADVMVESLGYDLGQHEGGQGNPLRGIELAEWCIDRNGRDNLDIAGTLTPDTAPNLPWPEDCGYARFGRVNIDWTGNERDLWLIDPETGEACYPEWMADGDREDVQTFWDALDAILARALAAGCAEYDYACSEECAAEWLADNDAESFDEDGHWT